MIHAIIITIVLLLIAYALRNIIALPIGFLFYLCGMQDATARSRAFVGTIANVLFLIVGLIGFIVTAKLLAPSFNSVVEHWMEFFKAFYQLIIS